MGSSPGDFQTLAWKTKIVVKLALAEQDIVSPSPVKPVVVLAGRQGFLPSLIPHFLQHVQHVLPFVPGQTSFKPWFDYRGLPLRWNLPTGVLFDLLAGEEDLPWELTVHFSTYPEELLPWDSPKALQDVFFNSLKESCHICCRSEGSNSVMRLSSAARQQLWEGVESCHHQQYTAPFAELNMRPEQRLAGSPAWWPSVPVKLLWRSHDAAWLGTWEHCFCTTRPFPAMQPDGSPTTLNHMLQMACPSRLEAHRESTASRAPDPLIDAPPPAFAPASTSRCESLEPQTTPRASPSSAAADPLGAAAHPTTLEPFVKESNAATAMAGERTEASIPHNSTRQHDGLQSTELSVHGLSFLVGGVRPPLDTPLAWLHAHLHAPDYFLYVAAQRVLDGVS